MALRSIAAAAAHGGAPLARAEQSLPVIVIGGLGSRPDSYVKMHEQLAEVGARSFELTLGKGTWGSIVDDASDLAAFVQWVKLETGAPAVHLLGHSKGGLVALEYLAHHGGADHVRGVMTLGTPIYGVVPQQAIAQALLAGKISLLPQPLSKFVDMLPGVPAARSLVRRKLADTLRANQHKNRIVAVLGVRPGLLGPMVNRLVLRPHPVREMWAGSPFMRSLHRDLKTLLSEAEQGVRELRIVNARGRFQFGSDGVVPGWSSYLRGPRSAVRRVTISRIHGNNSHDMLPFGNQRLSDEYRTLFVTPWRELPTTRRL